MRTVFISLLSLAIASCSAEEKAPPVAEEPPIIGTPTPNPTPSPTPAPSTSALDLTGKVLVVEGDELGFGAQSYAERYAAENPTLKVHNFSSEGATIDTLMARRQETLALNPHVISVSLTLHDICAASDARTWADGINEYVAPFKERGTIVVITTPLPRDSADDDDCDRRHSERFRGTTNRAFDSGARDFDAVAHFGGDKGLSAPGATLDSNQYVDGVLPTSSAQERLAEIYSRTMDSVWSVILGEPAPIAPADDGVTIIVAEGSSSAMTSSDYFNGLYKSKGGFDEWHAAAVGGSGIDSLSSRLQRVKFKNADVVSLYIGANDLHSYNSSSEFIQKLKDYTNSLRERGTKVLVFTLPNRTLRGEIDHQHNKLRKEFKAIFDQADWIDGYVDFAGHPVMGTDDAPLNPTLYRDGLHATPYGHQRYFEVYEPAMDRVIAARHPQRQ